MTHLFLFSIGPVQSFIIRARKTRDLYTASAILSELTRQAIIQFEEEFPEGTVVFPHQHKPDENSSMPNRFVAKINTASTSLELKQKAQNIEKKVRSYFEKMAKDSLDYLFSAHRGIGDFRLTKPNGFDKQVESYLDIFWAYQPHDGDYAQTYENLEYKLAAVKNLRPFFQLEETGRKCSLEGDLNGLFAKRKQSRQIPSYFSGQEVSSALHDLTAGETLSAIGLMKRFWSLKKYNLSEEGFLVDNKVNPQKVYFPSTAYFALLSDLLKLQSETGEEERKAFAAFLEFYQELQMPVGNSKRVRLPGNSFDWQYLFIENLTSANIPDPDQLKLLMQKQADFKKYLKQKYYAVIQFDGDSMGAWLSGAKLNDISKLEDFHNELSTRLASFAKKAQQVLSPEKGKTVYAGGDDFLGFVTLSQLFTVIKELRAKFQECVALPLKKYSDDTFSFSAGIVIAHYKEPLSIVLQKAREAEKIAKEQFNRNAFFIQAIKGSGEMHQAGFKWEAKTADGRTIHPWDELERLYKAYEGGFISSKYVDSMSKAIQKIGSIETNSRRDLLVECLGLELKRSLNNAMQETRISNQDEKINPTNAAVNLWSVFQAHRDAQKSLDENLSEQKRAFNRVDGTNSQKDLENFAHALQIVDFMYRKSQGEA
jgi:CRISPR-associated protein Cmr2